MTKENITGQDLIMLERKHQKIAPLHVFIKRLAVYIVGAILLILGGMKSEWGRF